MRAGIATIFSTTTLPQSVSSIAWRPSANVCDHEDNDKDDDNKVVGLGPSTTAEAVLDRRTTTKLISLEMSMTTSTSTTTMSHETSISDVDDLVDDVDVSDDDVVGILRLLYRQLAIPSRTHRNC